jgi:hypothetical protein
LRSYQGQGQEDAVQFICMSRVDDLIKLRAEYREANGRNPNGATLVRLGALAAGLAALPPDTEFQSTAAAAPDDASNAAAAHSAAASAAALSWKELLNIHTDSGSRSSRAAAHRGRQLSPTAPLTAQSTQLDRSAAASTPAGGALALHSRSSGKGIAPRRRHPPSLIPAIASSTAPAAAGAGKPAAAAPLLGQSQRKRAANETNYKAAAPKSAKSVSKAVPDKATERRRMRHKQRPASGVRLKGLGCPRDQGRLGSIWRLRCGALVIKCNLRPSQPAVTAAAAAVTSSKRVRVR